MAAPIQRKWCVRFHDVKNLFPSIEAKVANLREKHIFNYVLTRKRNKKSSRQGFPRSPQKGCGAQVELITEWLFTRFHGVLCNFFSRFSFAGSNSVRPIAAKSVASFAGRAGTNIPSDFGQRVGAATWSNTWFNEGVRCGISGSPD